MKAFAVGKFDALHLGHRALVEAASQLGAPALLTFSGMAEVLGWPARLPLVAEADRGRVLGAWSQRLGAPIGVATFAFARVRPLAPGDFLRLARDELGAGALVVGDDFRFGRDRAAGAAELVALAGELGMAARVVAAVQLDGAAVSSSRVRVALAEGDVGLAARLLGRPHRLIGRVVRGDGRGRTIGVPTANCGELANEPAGPGVYAARAWVDGAGPWPAAMNVGCAPTAGPGRAQTIEAHLIGFDGDCYGAALALEPIARLRDERRFATLDALRAQLADDIAAAGAMATAAR